MFNNLFYIMINGINNIIVKIDFFIPKSILRFVINDTCATSFEMAICFDKNTKDQLEFMLSQLLVNEEKTQTAKELVNTYVANQTEFNQAAIFELRFNQVELMVWLSDVCYNYIQCVNHLYDFLRAVGLFVYGNSDYFRDDLQNVNYLVEKAIVCYFAKQAKLLHRQDIQNNDWCTFGYALVNGIMNGHLDSVVSLDFNRRNTKRSRAASLVRCWFELFGQKCDFSMMEF